MKPKKPQASLNLRICAVSIVATIRPTGSPSRNATNGCTTFSRRNGARRRLKIIRISAWSGSTQRGLSPARGDPRR